MTDDLRQLYEHTLAEVLDWTTAMWAGAGQPRSTRPRFTETPAVIRPGMSLQEFVDSTPEGVTVYLPPGEYEGPLHLSGGRRLVGAGGVESFLVSAIPGRP